MPTANATEEELEGNESSGLEPQSTSSGSQNKKNGVSVEEINTPKANGRSM